MDLQKINDKIPSKKNCELIKNDPAFKTFCHNVILCTEQHYDESNIERLAKMDFKLDYKNSYIDLISKVIKELLIEEKVSKLQTFGYKLVKNDN